MTFTMFAVSWAVRRDQVVSRPDGSHSGAMWHVRTSYSVSSGATPRVISASSSGVLVRPRSEDGRC